MTTSMRGDTPLWEPSEERKQQANLTHFMQWLQREKGLNFQPRNQLWQLSVDHLEDFWASVWQYFHIEASKPYTAVLVEERCPVQSGFPTPNSILQSTFSVMLLPIIPPCSFAPSGTTWWKFRGVN